MATSKRRPARASRKIHNRKSKRISALHWAASTSGVGCGKPKAAQGRITCAAFGVTQIEDALRAVRFTRS